MKKSRREIMKIVCIFLVFLGLGEIEGASIKKEEELQAPHIRQSWSIDPAGLGIQWDPVEGLEGDPIIGYRMKVWELAKKVYSYEDVDGEIKLIEKIVPFSRKEVALTGSRGNPWVRPMFSSGLPLAEEELHEERFSFDYTQMVPKWIVDVGPDVTSAEVNDVRLDIFYEIRVQAITKKTNGPFSGPSRTAIRSKPKEDVDVDV